MFCIANKENFPEKQKSWVLFENETNYYLPRNIKNYISSNNIFVYSDKNFTPSKITPYKFVSTLREEQVDIIDEVLALHTDKGFINGIIHARPGTGKTFMSIWLACHLNQKTLIVIDTKNIMDQWKAEIIKHTDLTEDDIGLIKGKIFNVENKRFIITTPQTLASKVKNDIKGTYLLFKEMGIGLVVWDECHKMGLKFASGSLLFNTENVIGLSATPYNPKERDILVKSIFDDVIVRYGTYDFQPTIKFVKFDSGLGATVGKRVHYLWDKQFMQARSIYSAALILSETQINNIHEIVESEIDQGNRIILICMTKVQLKFICEHLEAKGITTTQLYSEKYDIDKTKDNVIVATYKYASHAFDYKELSRIILTVPLMGKKSLIQTIGRIVRRSEGKTDAIVYDMIDIDSGFRGIFSVSIKSKINILNSEFEKCIFINE